MKNSLLIGVTVVTVVIVFYFIFQSQRKVQPPTIQPENPCPSCFTPENNEITIEGKIYTKTEEIVEDRGEIFMEVVGRKIKLDKTTFFLVEDSIYTVKAMDLHHSIFQYYKWVKK